LCCILTLSVLIAVTNYLILGSCKRSPRGTRGFREAEGEGSDHMTKYCVLIGSPPLLVVELACRHVGQDKLLFKNASLYVKSCVETFFSVKVMGN